MSKAKTALDETSKTGEFVRTDAGYRHIVKEGGEFPPEAGRYHLYISYACPWASRCLAFLYLKGLEDAIGISATHPTWMRTRPDDPADQHAGWFFAAPGDPPLTNLNGYGSFPADGCIPDTINNAKFVRDLYQLSNDTTGKFSVPVLWDKKTGVIVNNESSEIIRMFNCEFNSIAKLWPCVVCLPDTHCGCKGWMAKRCSVVAISTCNQCGTLLPLPSRQSITTSASLKLSWFDMTFAAIQRQWSHHITAKPQWSHCTNNTHAAMNPTVDLYPEDLREKIDAVNEWVYPMINNGVYRCGFAQSQEAYDKAVSELFQALDRVEAILSQQRYLAGDRLTEADIRLFKTLIRFDDVYVVYFKTNLKFIHQYPNMREYVKEIYQIPEVKRSVNMEHIRTHYFTSHPKLNYFGIIPKGPGPWYEEPHNRDETFPVNK